MGSKASKPARTLNKIPQQAVKTQTAMPRSAPLVQPDRKPAVRPDGHDPQFDGPESQQLLDNLKRINPIQDTPQDANAYKPASSDHMSTTLQARQHFEARDPAVASRTAMKTLIPGQTITAIVRMLAQGESHDKIVEVFQIDPQVLEKLQGLSIPKAQGAQGGVGVRR